MRFGSQTDMADFQFHKESPHVSNRDAGKGYEDIPKRVQGTQG